MKIDNIVIGGGAAGLTCANFLGRAGKEVVLFEKSSSLGGLVRSYNVDGFVFDSGIRAIEDAGMVNILLEKLDIDLEFLENPVFIGIKDQWINLSSKDSLRDYEKMLVKFFPGEKDSIKSSFKEIKKIERDLDLLYSIDNPLFLDEEDFKDISYLTKTLFPWLFKMKFSKRENKKYQVPVVNFLRNYTNNQPLIDMITQHFFKKTPASFALGYFSLYKDYKYPLGSTGEFSERLRKNLDKFNVKIINEEIISINPEKMSVRTKSNKEYFGENIIWAGDQKSFYLASKDFKESKEWLNKNISSKGNDSIFSLNIGVDLDPSNFNYPHSFYTPSLEGLSSMSFQKSDWKDYIQEYLKKTTYEISIPSLRDKSLSPEGKTGIVISTLMDYDFVKQIREKGQYEEFKSLAENTIIDILNKSIFPNIKEKIILKISSTPLTVEENTGNFQGAINGWAFTNEIIPSISSMKKINEAILTPYENIYQCGHWTFSPSGLPVAILTGKLASDIIVKS